MEICGSTLIMAELKMILKKEIQVFLQFFKRLKSKLNSLMEIKTTEIRNSL